MEVAKLKQVVRIGAQSKIRVRFYEIRVGEGDDDRAIFSIGAHFELPMVVGMVVSG